jgi:YebC/PmpR family DNA-binding regulatory protein
MSGHSKWHSIKHKKGANDKKRGKIFTKHARLIMLAAKGGGDPDQNPALRTAVDSAKADNVPNDNIDRAIKKGSGEGDDAAQMFEITYEGYGPNGVALMIETLTDNKNRSFANVRTVMTKNGGNMGESGSVGYMFDKKGYFLVDCQGKDLDEAELEIIEMGADDIKREEGMLEVYSAPEMFAEIRQKLDAAKFKIEDSKLSLFAKNEILIEDLETAQKIFNLIEKLEEDDDVMDVISNFDIPQEVLDKVE